MTIRVSPLQCQLRAWTWNPPDGKDRRAMCHHEDIERRDPPQAPAGMCLGWSQPHTRGACYLRRGLARRRILPGSRDRVGCCPCTEPAGGGGGPTESNAQLMSAPARPPDSSSACPRPRRHWPCCLQSKNRCCCELRDTTS